MKSSKQTRPEKIILFGSYAYGNPTDDSDLDILVVTRDNFIPSRFKEKSMIYLRVSHAISEVKREFPVDLIVHRRPMHKRFIKSDSLFGQELCKNGRILYERNLPSSTGC